MVFRCQAKSGELFALRRWPQATATQRVQQIHQVVAAASGGCAFVPRQLPLHLDGRSWRSFGGYRWDLSTWVAGKPVAKNASLSMVRAGAEAIGVFHRSVQSLCTVQQRAPAVEERIRRAAEIDDFLPRLGDVDYRSFTIPLSGRLQQAFELLRRHWIPVHQEFSRSINGLLGDPMPAQFVLRDVHREHVLFTGSRVTGLIDFDAIRVDTPLADLVRWGGSFLQGREAAGDVWAATLAGHQGESSSLQGYAIDQFERLAGQLHRISIWISLANWLIWLALERRSFAADAEQISQRIEDLVGLVVADIAIQEF